MLVEDNSFAHSKVNFIVYGKLIFLARLDSCAIYPCAIGRIIIPQKPHILFIKERSLTTSNGRPILKYKIASWVSSNLNDSLLELDRFAGAFDRQA